MNKKIIVGGLMAAVLLVGAGSIALAAGSNYSGFRAMMGNRAPLVNQQNFDRFNEMHQLMLNGDYAGAQKIRTELGLGRGRGGNGGGCPMLNGQGRGHGQGAGCPMANGQGFVDKNNNGICDYMENLK